MNIRNLIKFYQLVLKLSIGNEIMYEILTSVKGHKVRKAAKIWDQYNQVPHLTQDTIWESDTIKHHTKEPRGQLFPRR